MAQLPTLRIGIVGAGFLAETRARCWRRVHGVDVELAGVASRSLDRAAFYAKRWEVGQVFETPEALLADRGVDLVDLCVPNHAHRPLAEQAARAGKQVLCTKPLSAYVGQDLPGEVGTDEVSRRDPRVMYRVAVADARAMADAAVKAGVALHYGENWIYAPSIARAAGLAAHAGGTLLEMRGWESHSGSHSSYSKEWRHTGGGALIRLASHPIGAMLWLKREEGLRTTDRPIRVVSVTAEIADLTRTEGLDDERARIALGWVDVESWGCVVLAFDDGSRAVAYGSDVMLGGMQSRLQLLGSNFHLECNLSPHDLLRAYAADEDAFGAAYLMEKVDGHAGWSTPIPDEDWSSGQQGLCQAVAEACVSGESSTADGELGLDTVRVVYAAYVSAAEGRRIDLSELDAVGAHPAE